MDIPTSTITTRLTKTFSVKRREDKKPNAITAMVSLQSSDVIIADNPNNVLKLFSSDGQYISSTEDPQSTMAITRTVGNNFATCGMDQIYFWTVRDQRIFRLDNKIELDDDADSISFNDDNFCILHRFINKISILDSKGNTDTKIHIKEAFGEKIIFGIDIHMDDNKSIFIPCREQSNDVLCVTKKGVALWHCKLPGSVDCLTKIGNSIFVTDKSTNCVHKVDTSDNNAGVLESQMDMETGPSAICFGKSSGKMYVAYDVWSEMKENVTIFDIS